MPSRPHVTLSALLAIAALVAGCGSTVGNTPAPPPACDAECKDEVTLRAIRQILKLAFNLTLQGKPVGPQDQSVDCPLGGRARIHGVATSNAAQGATDVDLVYELDACVHFQKDVKPELNFRLGVTGTFLQKGVLAVQPTATTALQIGSASVSVRGTVYEPPLDVALDACTLVVGQDAGRVAGKLCDRDVSVTF